MPPIVIDHSLGQGRKSFKLVVPSLGVAEVTDIPATVLTPDEWQLITLARQSYQQMWGGANIYQKIAEDPFDGRPPHDQKYLTTHQLAKFTSLDGKEKFLTNRKVAINPIAPADTPMFDDITFWQVGNLPLWNFFHVSRLQVAAISRTGTYPFVSANKSDLEHDSTAITWALMQIAVTENDQHSYIVCQLCAEFQDQVLTIGATKLDFTKTTDILHLDSVKLDRTNPYVQDHIFNFPGYWTNNSDLLNLLKQLSIPNLPYPPEIITKSRNCKYLIPFINADPKLRQAILTQVGDGPFSSTLIPKVWRASAIHLIEQGLLKYYTGS